MATKNVVIEVEVQEGNAQKCGEDCLHMDVDYCTLFGDNIEGGERCMACFTAEVEYTPEGDKVVG